MKFAEGFKRVYRVLNAHEVRYLVVGAYAVAYYGYPRYTGDIDFFLDQTPDNAKRVFQVVEPFGFGESGLTVDDFARKDQVVQLGVSPNRVDLMTFLSGITFEEAWASREQGEIDGLPVLFISKEMLKRNKAASGRLQDLADLEYL